ncbi:MAG: hypothetical protein GAK45_01217 [Pseudomonas citronellolis]|nr:MAG: hypothetical protein GAK45_01217 [Pseudomonas citronellolis]
MVQRRQQRVDFAVGTAAFDAHRTLAASRQAVVDADGVGDAVFEAEADQAVGHDQHDDRAHHALDHRATPATQAVAADHGGGQRENFQVQPRARADAAQAAGDEKAGQAGADAGEHIGEEHRTAYADTGVVRRAPRTANRLHVPAGARAGQREVGEHGDDQRGEHRGRYAEDGAVANEVPDIRGDRRHLHLGGEVDHQDVVQRAADDEGHQGGDEGAQAQHADQVAVERAVQRTGGDGREQRDPHRQVEDEQGRDGGERRQGEDRAHRQVDTAAEHDHREAGHHQRELAELAGRLLQ